MASSSRPLRRQAPARKAQRRRTRARLLAGPVEEALPFVAVEDEYPLIRVARDPHERPRRSPGSARCVVRDAWAKAISMAPPPGPSAASPARPGRCRARRRWACRSRLPGHAAVEPARAVAVREVRVLGAPQAGEGRCRPRRPRMAGPGPGRGRTARPLAASGSTFARWRVSKTARKPSVVDRRLVVVGEVRQRQVAAGGERGRRTAKPDPTDRRCRTRTSSPR